MGTAAPLSVARYAHGLDPANAGFSPACDSHRSAVYLCRRSQSWWIRSGSPPTSRTTTLFPGRSPSGLRFICRGSSCSRGLASVFYRLFSGALALTISLMVIFIGASVISQRRAGLMSPADALGVSSGNLSFTWHLVLDFVLLATLVVLWVEGASAGAGPNQVPA